MSLADTKPQSSGHGADAVRRSSNLTLAAYALMVLLGGMNGVCVRFTVLELAPYWGAALRFIPAAVLLGAAMFAMRLQMPRGRALLGVLLYGLLAFGATSTFSYWGLMYVPPGMGQVLVALVPLLTFFLAILHRLESFRWRGLVGAAIAFVGVAIGLQVQLAADVPLLPMLAIIAGAACIAESQVILKQIPDIHPVTTNTLAMATGAVSLMALSLLAGEPRNLPERPETWTALVYLILVGSIVVFMLLMYVIPRLRVSAVSYQFVLLPFVTVVASAVLTGEAITPLLVLGAALVLLGVWIGAISNPTQPETPEA